MGLFSNGEKANSDGASALWEGQPSNISKADWAKLGQRYAAANPGAASPISDHSVRQRLLSNKIHDAAGRGEN